MCYIADNVHESTGVEFEILGFDREAGMPEPIDYRDHSEKYFTGDFPLVDREELNKKMPSNCKLILGKISDSLVDIEKSCTSPIGFVSVDVDYYSSTIDCLKIFNLPSNNYLPYVFTYFDDIYDIDDNKYCGELLAINEFNTLNENRKIAKATLLNQTRLFRRSPWTHQMYLTHVFDHNNMGLSYIKEEKQKIRVLENPFL